MRLVVKKYTDGNRYLVETDNDATEVLDEDGKRQPPARISATVEVSADDNEAGINHLLEAIEAIQDRIQRRKQSLKNGA